MRPPMKPRLFLFVFFSLTLSSNRALSTDLTCPPAVGAEALTFQRIMVNMGRLNIKAELVVREIEEGESVETEILAALEDLTRAEDCVRQGIAAAQIAFQGFEEKTLAEWSDLPLEVQTKLPSGAFNIPIEPALRFLKSYIAMMSEHLSGLERYKAAIFARDVPAARNEEELFKNLALIAHQKLNTKSFCDEILK